MYIDAVAKTGHYTPVTFISGANFIVNIMLIFPLCRYSPLNQLWHWRQLLDYKTVNENGKNVITKSTFSE